ncbi:BrnA antitoxin family protein [Methylobacterium dankookense]|uniref:BrnA antitoxin family protein n=1 Tax=Methylobacterium dankookense TaxID=560405 RepID=UPI001EDDC179|nr:BrnA antitoxin family protein [Methylobacterium dankookense]
MPPLTDAEEAEIQAGIAQDPDNPEIGAEQFARMRPASEVLPSGLYQALTKRGRPPAENKAVQVTLRVPPDILAAYKATGPGWQTKMNEALAHGVSGAKTARYRTPSASGEIAPRSAGKAQYETLKPTSGGAKRMDRLPPTGSASPRGGSKKTA